MEKVIYGDPTIEGKVMDNASVHHDAYVGPSATVRENAWVCDDARIEDRATVQGNAEIHGAAVIMGDAVVKGNALVSGSVIVGGQAHIGGDASLHGEGYFGGFADINSNDDYAVLQGLTPHILTIYKSSVWRIEVAVGFNTSSLEDFLKYREFPQSLKDIVGIIAKKWQE